MPAAAPAPEPRQRVLLAEDDVRLAAAYERRLTAEGLDVDVVGSVADARDHEARNPYACLVLDRMLPDGDVLALVHEIDGRRTHPPIVLVSAVADEEDRVEGLRAGADDYVAKPVRLDELAVRVTRLVGAGESHGDGAFTRVVVGAVVFDLVRFRVAIGNEPLDLPDAERRLLRLLMVHADRVVGVDELAEELEPTTGDGADPVTEHVLAGLVHALGQALAGALAIERSEHGYRVRPGTGPGPGSRAHDRRRLLRRAGRRPRPS